VAKVLEEIWGAKNPILEGEKSSRFRYRAKAPTTAPCDEYYVKVHVPHHPDQLQNLEKLEVHRMQVVNFM